MRCGLTIRCTKILIRTGLQVDRKDAWASVHTTSTHTFVINLDSEWLNPGSRKPQLSNVLGHEIGHLVLQGLELSEDNEEAICDRIGHILAREK